MHKVYLTVMVLLLTIIVHQARAQAPVQSAQSNLGVVKGVVRDTSHNHVLQSATISIYKVVDNTLLSYQISNNYGEFSFKGLPLTTALRMDISHVGYQLLRKDFSIPADKKLIDMKTLIINPRDITLKDVVISIPPVSMNGDTLEFNAAAFKLDSNAVVEDLLRKIPNITLWGDGQITVNGREVKSVLVNGKPFFGGETKISTQNIPKNALEKVQVYNTVKDKSNPLDSTLEMNLKLKKGKDVGYFGKIGVGYGTDGRYETDASLNFFSPKMELAFIGASNNINKSAGNIRTLMANSTFKGVGTNIEYQPDFSANGQNRPTSGGVAFTYNFIEKPKYDKKSTLTANYFLSDRKNENLSETEITTAINGTDKIFENNINSTKSVNTSHKFDSKYEWVLRNQSLTLSQSFTKNYGDNDNVTQRSAQDLQGILNSTNNTFNQNHFNNSSFNFDGRYRRTQNYMKRKELIKDLNVFYSLAVTDNQSDRLNITDFKSYANGTSNRNFNRKYETKTSGINQQVDVEFGRLKTLFFGKLYLAGIDFSLTNKFNLSTQKDNNRVQDLDTLRNVYAQNAYLSNEVETTIIDETPGLSFNRSFSKRLSNRFSKNLIFSFSPKYKIVYQDNQSQRAFQNIKRNYKRILPDASVNYSDAQYGEYYKSYSLTYSTNLRIPTLQQLAPLTDSTNLYALQKGNVNLKAAVDQVIRFSFNHSDESTKNTLNYSLQVGVGMISNNIVDSIFIDDANRRTMYLTNADGSNYLNFSGSLRKSYKLKTAELQVQLSTGMQLTRNPGYTNDLFAFSNNLNTNSDLNLNYTYKSYFALEFNQSFRTYRSKQAAFNTEYSGVNRATLLSSSYNVTKKLTLNSNLTFNTSTSKGNKDINFTIWNASAIYRFLKGNNAEFKLAALDLLHQNTSIINYGSANSFTVGTQNVLQQYFMATLSYYPRQFGGKAIKK